MYYINSGEVGGHGAVHCVVTLTLLIDFTQLYKQGNVFSLLGSLSLVNVSFQPVQPL